MGHGAGRQLMRMPDAYLSGHSAIKDEVDAGGNGRQQHRQRRRCPPLDLLGCADDGAQHVPCINLQSLIWLPAVISGAQSGRETVKLLPLPALLRPPARSGSPALLRPPSSLLLCAAHQSHTEVRFSLCGMLCRLWASVYSVRPAAMASAARRPTRAGRLGPPLTTANAASSATSSMWRPWRENMNVTPSSAAATTRATRPRRLTRLMAAPEKRACARWSPGIAGCCRRAVGENRFPHQLRTSIGLSSIHFAIREALASDVTAALVHSSIGQIRYLGRLIAISKCLQEDATAHQPCM